MINRQIREFEDKVIEVFNAYPMEPEIKRLVAQNVLNLITKKADEVILKEIREGKQEEIYAVKEEE